MPGYRLTNYDELKIDKKYFCSFCKLLLRDAMQTSCGHFYCFSCLGNLRNPGLVLVCLVDKQQLQENEVCEHNFMRREVASIVVSCIFTSEGCCWRGEVRHLEMHVSHEHQRVPSDVPITERDGNERPLQTRVSRLEEYKMEVQRQFGDVDMELSLIYDTLAQERKFNRLAQKTRLTNLVEYLKKQENVSYDGQLMWRIDEYARKRREAVLGSKVSFCSQCFYTSRSGYKMCARIYLNGDGMGQGTHISLFLVVMRGEYDAILRWPFRQKVTIKLLDQDNVKHVIDAFRPDPNSSSFQRPRRETNIASGLPMFCSIEELNNHAYVRDDTMFIEIIVDTSDL
ncbi:TNF receptor-associated factor 3-like [Acropora millepora]|uniref:TNF receptor-associated factor 3-like n=1 Tax=Acropora millepora TaxID=45264 RepID=UPI001CF297D2|nr:TNF receptor-associated factor 3-like [Acropora millepora]